MILLKTPKIIMQPKMAEERSEDRCYTTSACAFRRRGRRTYLIVQDALEHDQTPCHQQGLDGVGESVSLVRPGHV